MSEEMKTVEVITNIMSDLTVQVEKLLKENESLRTRNYYLKRMVSKFTNMKDDGSHYKPGDRVRVKRLTKLGSISDFDVRKYSIDAYDKIMMCEIEHRRMAVEATCDIANQAYPEYHKDSYLEDFMIIDLDKIVGHVIDYDMESMIVKLQSEELMPDIGIILLESMTKQEFEDTMRIGHKMVVSQNMPNTTNEVHIDRIVSCFLTKVPSNPTN